MDLLNSIVVLLFVLLLASALAWAALFHGLDPAALRASPRYRLHQVLVAWIALLAILLVLVIVFASDPGDVPDSMLLP